MKKSTLILFTFLSCTFSFSQVNPDLEEYNQMNAALLLKLEILLQDYDAAEPNMAESFETFSNGIFKKGKKITRSYKKIEKVKKRILKNLNEDLLDDINFCFEDGNSEVYFDESIDQLIVNDDYLVWKDESNNSLRKAYSRLKGEVSCINGLLGTKKN